MRKITLHRPTADNAGRFVDAGSALTVGEQLGDDGENIITAARAGELLDSGGAVESDAEPAIDANASAFEMAAEPLHGHPAQ